MAPSPIFILGMHRSGTSAIAGALHQCGFFLGSDLLEAKPGINDRGFFEDKAVLALHEAIFDSWQRDWRVPLLPPEGWLDAAENAGFADRVDRMLDLYMAAPMWAVKDPRLCLLFPLWAERLAARGVTPKVILAARQPWAVAQSLYKRDQLAEPIGTMLWLQYELAVEQATRRLSRIVLRYDELVDCPRKILSDLVDWLECDVSAAALDQAVEFVTPALRRSSGAGSENIGAEVERVWNTFLEGRIDDPAAQATLDEISASLHSSLSLLGPVVEAQTRRIEVWEHDFTESVDQLGNALTDQQAGLDQAMGQLGQARDAVDEYQQAVDTQAAGFQQAVDMVKERDVQLATLQHDMEQLRQQVASNRWLEDASMVDGDADDELDYRGVIDLRVENNSHTRVARYIREAGTPQGGPVLEVGCASGYFGESLRELGFEVWGIEPSAAAAKRAAAHLDRVYTGSIETFLTDPDVRDKQFQFVVFGDVLEHLVDPRRTLDACRALITDGGLVIASIPNVAHRSVRLMLLEGRWDYDDTGILDRTHLHFFTRDSLVRLLDEAGFAIRRLSAIIVDPRYAGITVTPRVADVFEKHIHDREQEVFQFVVVASAEDDAEVRSATNEKFAVRGGGRILCLPPLKDSSLFSIRLGDPLTRLNEMYGGELRVSQVHELTPEDVEWADTVVFQRESNPSLLELMRRLRAAGKRIVFDIDDLLVDVPDYLTVAEHCREIRPWLETALAEADAVSASTAELREALLQYNPKVYITPNYAWTNEQPISHYGADAPLRIIVASSDSVRVDFLVDSLRKVIADPRLDVELVGIGPPGEYLRELGLPISTLPIMPHSQFKSFLVERDNTIALIPLDDNRFNRCKSAIKFFDYALAGVPCVCSAVVPYHNVIDDPDNGILCLDSEPAWTAAITALATDPERRQKMAETALERCLSMHNLDRSAASWEELLRDTAFPEGDPVYAGLGSIHARTPWQLLRGTLRHVRNPASYGSAWRTYRHEGIRRIWAKWKTVF